MWAEAKKHRADILCGQETHFQVSKTPKCTHRDFPHVFLACTPGQKKGGVLLALRNTLSVCGDFNLIVDPKMDRSMNGRMSGP